MYKNMISYNTENLNLAISSSVDLCSLASHNFLYSILLVSCAQFGTPTLAFDNLQREPLYLPTPQQRKFILLKLVKMQTDITIQCNSITPHKKWYSRCTTLLVQPRLFYVFLWPNFGSWRRTVRRIVKKAKIVVIMKTDLSERAYASMTCSL